jgi:hypothetical protein
VCAQRQPHSIGQKEKDGDMKDNTHTHVMAEAKVSSQGCSLIITRSKECSRSKLETQPKPGRIATTWNGYCIARASRVFE